MPTFERYKMWLGSTWAYKRFRAHQTEINNLYWSFVPAAGFTNYLAQHATADLSTDALFHATGPNVHRLASTPDEWQKHFREFQNWVRLAALLSSSSYLEVYIRTAVTLALQSDPLARFGRSRLMDGITWLKEGMRDDVEQLVRPCVMGDWSKRASAYKLLFGATPVAIVSNIAELDRMRVLRNSVGHSFGRTDRKIRDDLSRVTIAASERLSEDRFKKWLGLIDQVADSIDRQLGLGYIGEFETMAFYHHWKTQPRPRHEGGFTDARAFSHALGRRVQQPCGQEFSTGLIDYYNSQ